MNKKVLLIEDDSFIRENTAEILRLANYSVETAENGKIGISIAKSFNPDIIICDIMMPVLDGYGVLQIVSKTPELKHIPFVFLTAKTYHNDFRKGMELGADDYISKPFQESELLRSIEARLKRAKNLAQDTGFYNYNTLNIEPKLTNNKDVENLLLKKNVHSYKSGENIYCQGNQSNHVFLIKKGLVKTYKMNEFGKEFITGFYKEKQYFGYTSFIKQIPHFENSKAITNTSLYKVDKEEIKKLVTNNPNLLLDFINIMATELINSKKQTLLLAYCSVRKKTAQKLLNLFDNYPLIIDNEIIISRSDLASFVGIAKETLIRTLHDFKDEKLLEISSKSIKILDKSKLKKIN